ncbi:MAG: glycosyltransferase [Microthrixaceae bacterium]|jgi:glycosyltransferase involved in cell wall biosynthesis
MPRTSVLLLARGLGPGGMERLLVNQVRFGDRSNFDYSVAFVTETKHHLVPEFEALDVPVHWLSGAGRTWPVHLAELLRRGGFDVVHTHSPLVASVARPVARTVRPRPRLVYTEHNSWGAYRGPTRLANRWTYRLDDTQIAVSRAAFDSVPPSLRGHVTVLDHGIDLDAVRAYSAQRAEARERLGAGDGDVVVGTVANFRPEKNYEGMVRIAGQVLEQRPTVRFVSIGQGPLLEEIRSQVDRAGLGGRFACLGHQPDAPRLMAGFDVFVMTSHFEGLPVAFMEARALGLPVVTTAVGGLVDHVVDGEDGLLVTPGDDGEFVEALGRVLDDPTLRSALASASAERGDDFDARRVVRSIEAAYV